MHRKNWSGKYDIEFAGKFSRNFLWFTCAATCIYEACKVISSVIRFKHFFFFLNKWDVQTLYVYYFLFIFYFLKTGKGKGRWGIKKWGNENGQ